MWALCPVHDSIRGASTQWALKKCESNESVRCSVISAFSSALDRQDAAGVGVLGHQRIHLIALSISCVTTRGHRDE